MGIDKCKFYGLRRSYATKILNNRIVIHEVVDILGHKNVETPKKITYLAQTEATRQYVTEVCDEMLKRILI